MADITMCSGTSCWRKDTCYRHIAPVNEFRQAYFTTPPFKFDSVLSCDYFWPILPEKPLHEILIVDKIKNL